MFPFVRLYHHTAAIIGVSKDKELRLKLIKDKIAEFYDSDIVAPKLYEISQRLIPFIIFAVIMLFEWEILELYGFQYIQKSLKLALILTLCMLIPAGKVRYRQLFIFLLLFTLFIVWSIVPCLISDSIAESMQLWVQMVTKLLFMYLVGIYLMRNRKAALLILKFIVVVAAFTLVQFIVQAIIIYLGIAEAAQGDGFWGPFGLLGKPPIQINFLHTTTIFLRFTGFWREPSNASGFLLASSFISFAIYSVENLKKWKIIGLACLIGGLACISNAGYIALVAACLFGISSYRIKPKIFKFVLVTAFIPLLLLALYGRALVYDHYMDNNLLRAMVGLSQSVTGEEIDFDPSGGRIELFQKTLVVVKENPVGIGLRIPGGGFKEDVSASAPIIFLLFTGPVGLIILLVVETYILIWAFRFSKRSQFTRRVSQAWVVVLAQNLSYGNWMSTMFLFLSVLILVSGREGRQPPTVRNK